MQLLSKFQLKHSDVSILKIWNICASAITGLLVYTYYVQVSQHVLNLNIGTSKFFYWNLDHLKFGWNFIIFVTLQYESVTEANKLIPKEIVTIECICSRKTAFFCLSSKAFPKVLTFRPFLFLLEHCSTLFWMFVFPKLRGKTVICTLKFWYNNSLKET